MRKFFPLLIALVTAFAPCVGAVAKKNAKASIIPAEPELRAKGCAEYRFVFEDFPVHHQITVSLCRVLQEDFGAFTKVSTICLDEQGVIEFDDQVKARIYGLDPVHFVPGERVQYRFEDRNQLLCEVSYIPKPISVSSKEGTFTMTAELYSIGITNWRLRFHGIEEGEQIFLTSNSCGEILTGENPYRACDVMLLSPDVIGEVGGNDEVKIRRQSGDQATLTLPWGTQILSGLGAEG